MLKLTGSVKNVMFKDTGRRTDCMNEVQEQFLKALAGLLDLAKTKKNTLEYDEILKAFDGI